MKVLVADDSQPIRERLVDRLSRLPHVKVSEAVDTLEALQQMKTFEPDVAVLDIRMPGGGGIRALTEIKKKNPDTTVIIMTNYPYAQYRRKCLEAGADFFFDKSSEFEQIAETVHQLMQSGKVSEVAHRTAAAQLVAAKEELEKAAQRQSDMNLLSPLHKPAVKDAADQTYAMWGKTFDAFPDLVSILDANHSIIRVNKALADRLGVPAIELTGKKCFEYFHGAKCPVSGCPHDAMLKDFKEHSAELYEEHMGGWFDIRVSPVFEGNVLVGAIHIARDITAKRKAEQALKASESSYRQLFESMQAGFALHEIICDQNGVPCDYRFLQVNAAFEELTGLKAENIVGRTVKQVLPDTESRWIEIYGKVALTGVPVRLKDFSGALGRSYSVSAYSPVKGQFATIFADVTDQKNAEAAVSRARTAAEESNRAKTQFMANMSHELRTPLNAIIGLTELLEDSPLDDEQRDYVQTIGVSGESLLMLISDLLDFSKIEMGRIDVRKEKFNVREVVAKSMALLSSFAEAKKLTLTESVDADVPETVTGDAVRLQQVLVNLLNNAIKFTENGFVRLVVRGRVTPAGSRYVEFSVEDSGPGMAAETAKRIFEPFYQADASVTREHGGTGLGLSISKSLVEMMGGEIHVESREPGGSVFRFYILDHTASGCLVDEAGIRAAWQGRHICVWDNNPADLRAVEYLMERCGIIPVYAESPDKFVESLACNPAPDAVLCNLDMEEFPGRFSELHGMCRDIPWIGVSNWHEPAGDEIRELFDAFVDRPIRAQQLYRALAQLSATGGKTL